MLRTLWTEYILKCIFSVTGDNYEGVFNNSRPGWHDSSQNSPSIYLKSKGWEKIPQTPLPFSVGDYNKVKYLAIKLETCQNVYYFGSDSRYLKLNKRFWIFGLEKKRAKKEREETEKSGLEFNVEIECWMLIAFV